MEFPEQFKFKKLEETMVILENSDVLPSKEDPAFEKMKRTKFPAFFSV